ncbi:hypothetical protein GZ77_01750 [Endozoicomonas montiporae]|uniref:Uncharacterized protein n=2 Tax=Endozoicomonas montiporae TaxID=1027273 RepID=A0A081NAC4_9GAMM|nr:hypothetical protein [Endozoicomonas montiporae]AMO56923.1 hypothetical protein EZMO1_2878 [Endozoicomonas montiporae CL-33]KEQ15397.1 hypothetical protein GZ77_01750 [Endozoicomonas montiporae]
MLFRALKKTGLIALFIISVFALQAQAENESTHEYRRPPSMLPENIDKLKPTVLLCFVREDKKEYDQTQNVRECKEYIGYVTKALPETNSAHVCKYDVNGTEMTEYTHFEWLDADFYAIDGFMHFHASTVTIPGSEDYYYAMRPSNRPSTNIEPICAFVHKKEGKISFGYEHNDNGNLTCGKQKIVRAVYNHTYERINCAKAPQDSGFSLLETMPKPGGAPGSCPDDAVTTKCRDCNGDGCGAFKCSAFTHWDTCPDDTLCGYEKCVGGFCPDKPWCRPAEKSTQKTMKADEL